MILVSQTYWAGMPFWFRRNPEGAKSESLVLRAHDLRQLRAVCWSSEKHPPPRVGVVLMHPRVDFTHHYAIPRLLQAGFCVLGAMTRGGGSDVYVEHEEMLLDLAACIRFLKEKRNVERVVLFGNSGGGSLSAYYQAEARRPAPERTKESPAGNPTRFDSAPMTPADLMVYVAAHPGQGKVLADCIDPSVTDENDPLSVDASLDMYDPKNGFREPPSESRYSAEFLARYRTAQRARVARIDEVARAILERQKSAAPGTRQRVTDPMITVYRTMANPHYVDLTLEPSKRDYGSLLSERPDLMNYSSVGFARTCTARSWLSTWSAISSKADLAANVARIREPSLFVNAARDREVFPSDARRVFEAMASTDKTWHELEARHYFEADPGSGGAGDADAMMDIVIAWIQERVEMAAMVSAEPTRHSAAQYWVFPPADRPAPPPGIARTNLRELVARPTRFEHHLVVCASIGNAQLEITAASEPLYFAHINLSDELVVALPTGDDLADQFPLRTFLARPDGTDAARYNHRNGDLVLHPQGWLHWPGRLRPPYAPFDFPAGMRRSGLSIVYCANTLTRGRSSMRQAPEGRAEDVKVYTEPAPPMLLSDLKAPMRLGTIGKTYFDLVVRPSHIVLPKGGFVVVLESDGASDAFPCDLFRLDPGARLDGAGIVRALVFGSEELAPDAVPSSWSEVPAPPFAPYEEAAPGTLPVDAGTMHVSEAPGGKVSVKIGEKSAEVPRYWLARMLYRLALHGYRLGYVETYEGFFVDDRGDGPIKIGVRNTGAIEVNRNDAPALVERLYRAIAPTGYVERLR